MRIALYTTALALIWIIGCGPEATQTPYVARVGDQKLTEASLSRLLEQAMPGQDTTALRGALIEQWIADALLYDAARQKGLLKDEQVARQIEQNTHALLSSAYIARYLDDHPPRFTEDAIQQYYDQNREHLRLREPYIHYHLFGGPTEAVAGRARQSLTRRGMQPDTLWQAFRQRSGFIVEVDSAGPERGLYATVPEVRDVLLSLRPGQTSGVISTDSLYYVVHLVERVDIGEAAPLDWMRPEILHRLTLDSRKQAARRLVQQLRAEALARGALDVPTDSLQ